MYKILVIFSLFAVALARPDLGDNDGTVSVRQSTLGTYKYNVELKDASHNEERFPDGSVVGEYSILGTDGKHRTFKYTSGIDGFRIVSGPVPVAPVDNSVAPLPPAPVEDTPEVQAAKYAIYAAYKAALDAAAVNPE